MQQQPSAEAAVTHDSIWVTMLVRVRYPLPYCICFPLYSVLNVLV
jgi:hypothetical protein